MFDFEKLEVYQLASETNQLVIQFLYKHPDIDVSLGAELKKYTVSMLTHLVEGTGRMLVAEKKHFVTLSRCFIFQSVAILNLLKDLSQIDEQDYERLYNKFESLSKMLLGMYRSFK